MGSGRLTYEVGYRLEGLLLAHDEAHALFLAVSQKFGVADAPLLPLLIAPAEELRPDFHKALQVLFSRRRHDFWKFYLLQNQAC